MMLAIIHPEASFRRLQGVQMVFVLPRATPCCKAKNCKRGFFRISRDLENIVYVF